MGHFITALRRRWRAALGLGLLAALALTAAASAAVPGIERVTRTIPTPNDSLSPKSIPVPCPAGKQVLGVGGGVQSNNFPNPEPFGRIVLDDLTPGDPTDSTPDLTQVTVSGVEDRVGTTLTWGLRAEAICADPLPGMTVRKATATSDRAKTLATPFCPSGNVVGAGADLTNAKGRALLQAIVPVDQDGDGAPENVVATAVEAPPGTTARWTLDVYAICADPLPGLELVSALSAGGSNSLDSRSANVACPAGKKVLGSGFAVNPADAGQIVVSSLRFDQDLNDDGVGDGVSVAAHEDHDRTDVNWSIRAYAVCATP